MKLSRWLQQLQWLRWLALPALLALLACRSPVSSDLDSYLEERRAAGMSEVAAAELSAIAAVEAGSLTVSYERDADGRYFSIFTSRSCKRPGTSQPQLAAYRTEQQQATAVQLERLKELADADRSGFVSTREGTAVAQLVKFAWQATYITEQEGPDLPRVARAMGMPPQKFIERLWSYRNLLQRNHGRDPKLRDIPL